MLLLNSINYKIKKSNLYFFNIWPILYKDNYRFCLVHKTQKVTEWIKIYLVKISGDELCSLLNAMKKIKTVEFNSCTILPIFWM